ncbi:MAG: serine hydrolase [Bacteroidetes bacterium]|nr:serine hydrolase [Bacteroidota bacterium]
MIQISNQSRNAETMSSKVTAICLDFSLVLCFLLIWLASSAQMNFSEVDVLLKQNQKQIGNNFVVLVWKDGQQVYQKQVEKQVGDFNAKTQVPIGNCSQWLTAALVMTFVDEGKLSLDDKVSKFIPIYEKYMKSYITIRNCLTNTTGIQADAAGAMKILQKGKFESLEDEVNSFASKREIATNPGTEFYYSHVGPNIAGRILEIISKKSFDRLIQERIIRPLKMRGTTFADDKGGAVNPSGGAQSTANDYMNFLAMLLNKGEFMGKRILSEKSVEQILTAQLAELPVKSVPKGYDDQKEGLGTWIQKGNVVGSMNLNGTWPFIDRCRNYAAIIMVKDPETDPKREIYQRIKEAIDAQMSGNCN